MATCDVHPDPASLSDEDFLALMHDKLPPYVVKCMLAAGFDDSMLLRWLHQWISVTSLGIQLT